MCERTSNLVVIPRICLRDSCALEQGKTGSRIIDRMPHGPNQKNDSSKPIDSLNSLPVVEQPVWAKLLIAELPVTRLIPQVDLAAIGVAFDVSKLAVASKMASEIFTLAETARVITDVSKLEDVARLASEFLKVAEEQ
jgi:hypothetical protein